MKTLKHNLFWQFLFLCLLLPFATADAANPFRLRLSHPLTKTVNVSVSSDTTLYPFGDISSLYGLAVNATVEQHSDDSQVRILLIDTDGKEYLVLETSKILNDTSFVSFTSYCEETNYLSAVNPFALHIIARDATVHLSSLHYQTGLPLLAPSTTDTELTDTREEQVQEKANRINTYNQKYGILWVADVTELAKMPYADRKRVLGCTSDDYVEDGYAYYVGGIFSRTKPQNFSASTSNPNFVKEFSWTNRHGKNWMTSVKNQGGSRMCTSFATASVVEALINLYHNKDINLHLSEPEIAVFVLSDSSRSYRNAYNNGFAPYVGADYVVTHGISRDDFFKFKDSPNAYIRLPKYNTRTDSIKPSAYGTVVLDYDINGLEDTEYLPLSYQDSVKSYLIKYGPLISGVRCEGKHSITLVGYKTLQVGDTIAIPVKSNNDSIDVITPDHDYLGQTVWLIKDSFGDKSFGGSTTGYAWILYTDDEQMAIPVYFRTPVINWEYDKIICSDDDGDGYYFWGIGERPTELPSWIPNKPDGDDSDPTKGPMDEYGRLEDLPGLPPVLLPILLNQNQEWTIPIRLNRDVLLHSDTLTLKADVDFLSPRKLTILSGATLVIDGCSLYNVILDAKSGSTIILKNEGQIKTAEGYDFSLPLGASLKLYSGSIQ